MKYMMIYDMAPDGLEKARRHYQAHRARLDEFHARGVLVMAGPLVNPIDRALGIFTSREAAEEFIQGDPFVTGGAVGQWTIREWDEVYG